VYSGYRRSTVVQRYRSSIDVMREYLGSTTVLEYYSRTVYYRGTWIQA
jgi:hypothetical protein